MSIEPRKSQELANLAMRFRMASGVAAPTLADIQQMFKKSKEVRDCVIEWSWTDQAAAKSYTLVGVYPHVEDTGWWNYEVRDDPTWTLSEDRAQGNPTIWEYKTSDLQLVLEIVQMVGSRNLRASGHAGSDELCSLTRVFPESLTDQYQVLKSGFNPNALQDICAVLRSLGPAYFSGRVQISSHGEMGQIFFVAGIPTHAFVSGVSGDAALAEIISWQVGTIAYAKEERIEITSVTRHIETLIQDGFFLLEQKRYLAQSGLAYESYLSPTNVGEIDVRATLNDWQRRIYDRVDGRSSLVDILRDLHMESSEWVSVLVHLLSQRLVQIGLPRPQRDTALNFLAGTDHGVDEQFSQFLSPQTGMHKHHTLVLFAQRELYFLRRYKSPVSLIVFEMQLPEGRGNRPRWLTTDNVKLVARKIELLKRPGDMFAHFESLDYALVLPNTDLKQATIVAKILIKILTESALCPEDPVQLSLACGVASLPDHGDKLARLFGAAKFAKRQAKMWRLPLVIAQTDDGAELVGDHSGSGQAGVGHHGGLGASPARGEHRPSPTGEHRSPTGEHRPSLIGEHHSEPETHHESAVVACQLSDLLIRAGLISPDHYQQARVLLDRMPVPMPVSRVLAMEGHIQERTVKSAEEIQTLIENQLLSVEQGIRALQLVGNHDLDLDTVLKRMGKPRIAQKTNLLGELLQEAGLVESAGLEHGLRQSANTSLPLGSVLVSMGLLSQSLLLDALTALAFVTRGQATREQAIEALQAGNGKAGSFWQSLREGSVAISATNADADVALEELLVLAGVLSAGERMIAREISLVDEKQLQLTLIECGFASESCLHSTRQLLAMIEKGDLTRERAAQILRKSKRDNYAPDIQQSIEDLHKPQPQKNNDDADGVELLKAARLISERQLRGAQTLAAAKKIPVLKTLLDAGVIDQEAVELIAAVKEGINADKVDMEQAIIILRYCKEEKMTFDRALKLFGWSSSK